MTRRRAATTRLEPGEHSIDRNTPTARVRGGREVVVLDWALRLHDGRLLDRLRTQGPTAAEVRRRAKRKAAELLAAGTGTQWKPTTRIERYVDEVVTPEIKNANLRPDSVRQYTRAARLLRRQLAGHSIASAWHYDVLVDALVAIAAENGREASRQARTVLSKYVAQPLMRHRLADRFPLDKVHLDLSRHAEVRTDKAKVGGRALTAEEQERVIVHLLERDPGVGVPLQARGRWSYETRVLKRRRVIELALLQAGTGLRMSEALQITYDLVDLDRDDIGDDVVHINVTTEIAKTRQPRRSPIADPRIAAYFRRRVETARDPGEYLIGAPADPMRGWTRAGNGGATNLTAELYTDMATFLVIPLLESARSHVWRTTLSKRYEEAGVPREYFVEVLGHDERTNAKHYTDRTDTSALISAYRRRHRG